VSEQSPLVIVGVDGSRESVDALTWAIRYAGCTDGTVRAVIAWDEVIRYGYFGMYMGSYMPNLGPDVEKLHQGAADTLAAVVRDAAGERRRCRSSSASGKGIQRRCSATKPTWRTCWSSEPAATVPSRT